MSRARWTLALAAPVAALLVAILARAVGTQPQPPDRPAPALSLPTLSDPQRRFSPADMRGQVWILNVWASWCTACRDEHPRLLELARTGAVPLLGLNYRDGSREARTWLRQLGDPFRESMVDAGGQASMDLGVRGVPVTLVIDSEGVVRYRHTGALTREALDRGILPAVRKWRR